MLKILVADDHPIVADGISNALAKNADWQLVGTADTVTGCEQMLKSLQPDLLVLDIGMPEDANDDQRALTGANALRRLPKWKHDHPALRVLVFTLYGEPAVIQHALHVGADGFVLKSSPIECLLEGIQTVAVGDTYLCPAARQTQSLGQTVLSEPLTRRETEVLRLIVEGLSEKMVADRLGLSFYTVHSYMKFLRMKLCVNNTAALVRKALELRLV